MNWIQKVIVIVFAVLCMTTCKNKTEISIDRNLIKLISDENKESPISIIPYSFFCKCDSSRIAHFKTRDLYLYHQTLNENINYEVFVTEVLNQKRILNCKDKFETFKLSEVIKENYQNMAFDAFLNDYCVKKDRSGEFSMKNNLDKESLYTVLYYLFINNYIACFDDYSGFYNILHTSLM